MIVLTVVWQVLQASTIEMPTSTFCSYFFFFFTIPSYPTASLLFVTFVSIYPRRRNTSAKASLSPHEATLKRTIIGRYLSISLFVVVVLLIPNVSGMAIRAYVSIVIRNHRSISIFSSLFASIRFMQHIAFTCLLIQALAIRLQTFQLVFGQLRFYS